MSDQPPEDLDWSPLVPGGAAFRTHRLLAPTPTRIELHPSANARALVGAFALGSMIAVGFVVWRSVAQDVPGIVTAGAFAVIFAGFALMLHKLLDNHRYFDAELGRYWSTRKASEPVPLSSIRGLQITPERVIGPESDYDAYELNLVLVDGRRVNVLDHGNLEQLHADAKQIAAFSRVPLWIEPGLQRLLAIDQRSANSPR
jgi:hypothetical protein